MATQSAPQWGGTTWHGRARGRRRRVFRTAVVTAVAVLLTVAARTAGRDGGGPSAASDPDCHLERCTGGPGVDGAPVTRAEVAARADRWLDDRGIGYSMTEGHAGPGGWGWYRRDCSGFVSMALHLPDDNGGPSTVGLAADVVAVPAAALRPYDLIGRLGPHSGGADGHVQLFLGWADARHTRVRVAEQGGLRDGPSWPHVTTYAWPERLRDGTALRPYRYARLRD